jgi:hypothetical protein
MSNQTKPDMRRQQELKEREEEEYVVYEIEEEEEEQPSAIRARPAEPATGIMRFLPKSRKTRVTLASIAIVVMVVLAFFAPPEGDSDNVTGDLPATPTVVATNQLESIDVNRSVDVKGIHITVQNVQVATKFSDDHKRAGNYTVRVQVQTKNNGKSMIGLDYSSIVRLILPDGSVVAPKYLSVHPEMMPGAVLEGYFDFPLTSLMSASSLSLRFDNGAVVSFGS